MIDRLFFPVFAVVTALAFASGVFSVGITLWNERADAPKIIQLERVVIVGKRVPAAAEAAPLARADEVAPAARQVQ